MSDPYRNAAITLSREHSWRAPDYDSPLKQCPKCRASHLAGTVDPADGLRWRGWTWPTWCRGSWWRRLFRLCPDGEHMHQNCTSCKGKWTTGLEKSE